MHNSSKRIMSKFFDEYVYSGAKILDLGSQVVDGAVTDSYRDILIEKNINSIYVGADMVEGTNVDVVLENPYDWRFMKSNSFDFVICGQVLEHVEFFWITLIEIRRVLKPGGICCIIAPSSGYEHKYPVDCYRYYPDGMRAISKYAGLKTLEAYAEWNDEFFLDLDLDWRDCVLIAQKPNVSKLKFIKNDIVHFFIKKLSLIIDKYEDLELEKSEKNIVYKNDIDIKRNISLMMNKLLYVDLGNGFNEINKIKGHYEFIKDQFIFKFTLPMNCIKIRFDPIENYGCIISDLKVIGDGNELNIFNHNAKYIKDIGYIFNQTDDPQFIIDLFGVNITDLNISGRIKFII